MLPATPEGENGFDVLAIDPGKSLILGGLYDAAAHVQRPFSAPRPPSYWQVTWACVLEPLGESRCSFISRYRSASSEDLVTRLSFGPTVVEPIGFAMDR